MTERKHHEDPVEVVDIESSEGSNDDTETQGFHKDADDDDDAAADDGIVHSELHWERVLQEEERIQEEGWNCNHAMVAMVGEFCTLIGPFGHRTKCFLAWGPGALSF